MDYYHFNRSFSDSRTPCKGQLKYANYKTRSVSSTCSSYPYCNTLYATSISDNRNNIPYSRSIKQTTPYYPVCYPSDIPNSYMSGRQLTSFEYLRTNPQDRMNCPYEANQANQTTQTNQATPAAQAEQTASYPTLPYCSDLWASYDQDIDHFRSLYPSEIKKLLLEVEKALDEYDYDGSFIYDEYPDVTTLLLIAQTLYETLENELKEIPTDTLETMQLDRPEPVPSLTRDWFLNIIIILMFNNILYRRRNKDMECMQ